MASPCIGLDIGTSSLKAAQLSRTGSACKLERVCIAPIPLGAIEGGTVRNIDLVTDTVTGMLRQSHIKASRVMASVAGQAVIVRSLKFPAMSRKELGEAIKWEAERYIPFPAEEAVMDFDVVTEAKDEGDEQEVMLVAAQKAIVESHVAVLKAAKLQPVAIDVQPFAMARALGSYLAPAMESEAQNVAMIDIGAGTTDLVIFRQDSLRFHRIIPIGGNYFTRAIAGRLGISDEAAEALKLARGQVPLSQDQQYESSQDSLLASAISGVMDELVTEIRRSLDYFRLQYHEEVSRLVAAGGGIMLRNMVEALESELGLKVEVGDPLRLLEPGSRDCAPELLDSAGAVFAVAIGLALRGAEGI